MKNSFCCQAADILLPPRSLTEQGRWASIACDQFTSEPHYWEEADRLVQDAPSTLRMMLPEVYLSETDRRLPAIHRAMQEALDHHLVLHENAMIAVARTQSDGRIRHGLVACIDLEAYDDQKGTAADGYAGRDAFQHRTLGGADERGRALLVVVGPEKYQRGSYKRIGCFR